MAVELKIIEKIEALLRQAESTIHEEESKAFTQKAQAMLAKYALSEYDLDVWGQAVQKDSVKTVAFLINDPHLNPKSTLLSTIASAQNLQLVRGRPQRRKSVTSTPFHEYGCPEGIETLTLATEKPSKNYRKMYMTGFSKDIEATVLLFTSLLAQAKNEISRADVPPYVNKSTWTSHFFLGFASAIRPRLNQGKRESVAEVVAEAKAQGFDLLPVLVERSTRVKQEYDQVWKGNLRHGTSGHTRSWTGGQNAGRAAGARSDIGSKRIGGTHALGA